MKKELELHIVLNEKSMDLLYLILSFYKMANSLLPISDSKSGKFADELVTVIEKIKKDNEKEE